MVATTEKRLVALPVSKSQAVLELARRAEELSREAKAARKLLRDADKAASMATDMTKGISAAKKARKLNAKFMAGELTKANLTEAQQKEVTKLCNAVIEPYSTFKRLFGFHDEEETAAKKGKKGKKVKAEPLPYDTVATAKVGKIAVPVPAK